MTEIADVILASIPEDRRYALMDRCMETENRYLQEHPCPIGYPGVKETMAQLAKKHRLFIVSNSQCGYPELCIEKLGLGDYISGHLCFGDTGTEKGETIRRLMQQHNIQSAVYIGDTQGDCDAAAHAGIPFIFATYGFGQPDCWIAKIDRFEDLLTL
jgi:phosphoglycolate phosphatase